MKYNNRVCIEWEDLYLREGDPKVTEEKFLKTKWNKHVEGGLAYESRLFIINNLFLIIHFIKMLYCYI